MGFDNNSLATYADRILSLAAYITDDEVYRPKPDPVLIPCDQVDWVGWFKAGGAYGVEAFIDQGIEVEVIGYSSGYDLMFYQYKGRPMEHGEWDSKRLEIDQSLVPEQFIKQEERYK